MPLTVLLRLTLLAFVCTPIGCGPSPDEGSYESIEKAATSTLADVGGKAERKTYSALGHSVDAWAVDLSSAKISDQTFEALKGLDRVCGLNMSNSDLSDSHMSQLADPKLGGSLVDLDLSGTRITDAGLASLTESFYLHKLGLTGTGVTDAGVKAWQQKRTADSRIVGPFKMVAITR